jgi:hypothetical protein
VPVDSRVFSGGHAREVGLALRIPDAAYVELSRSDGRLTVVAHSKACSAFFSIAHRQNSPLEISYECLDVEGQQSVTRIVNGSEAYSVYQKWNNRDGYQGFQRQIFPADNMNFRSSVMRVARKVSKAIVSNSG